MRRLLTLVIFTALMSGSLLAVTNPAHAAYSGYRWSKGTICVRDTTSSRWPVKSASYRADKLPDLRFVYKWRSCKGYSQKIHVYEGWYGKTGWYAYTQPYVWSDGRIAYVKLKLNNSYRNYHKRSTILHELGHASGLDHTSYYSSLMNVYRYKYYDYYTTKDKRDINRLYPW